MRKLTAALLPLVMLVGCDTPLIEPGDAGVMGPVQIPNPDAPLNQIQIRGNLRSDWDPTDELPLAFQSPSFVGVSRGRLRDQLEDDGARAVHLGFRFRQIFAEAGPVSHYYSGAEVESRCVTMTSCLDPLVSLRDLPWAGPIFVLFQYNWSPDFNPERADEYTPEALGRVGYPFPAYIYQLEYLTSRVPRERIFAPGDLQGDAATLRDAVRTNGWPSLSELDGKFIFVLTSKGEIRDDYLRADWRAALGFGPEDQRVFLVADSPEDDHAAFFSFRGPDGVAGARAMADAGFMVHGESVDPDTIQAYTAAGAHVLTTVHMQDIGFEEAARCNPVTALAGCYQPGPLPEQDPDWEVVEEGDDAP